MTLAAIESSVDYSRDASGCGLSDSSAEIVSISEVLKVSVWEGCARQKLQRSKDATLLECCLGLKERPRCVCLGVCTCVCSCLQVCLLAYGVDRKCFCDECAEQGVGGL